ncbi:MAG: iron ABC transporter permease, partial [Chloroflexi bacterium]|nr:iron ABC transporter permease [Chloroflexota bacterium]
MILLPLLFFALFYLYPLFAIFSLSNAGEIATALIDLDTWRVTAFTFWQAFLSTIATLIIGLPAAYLVGRYRFRGRDLLRALTAIPFVMPTLVVGAGFSALIGERGWINIALESLNLPTVKIVNTLTAIILAHVFYNTTIVIRTVGDYWSHLDPRLTQVARTLGANPIRIFTTITLPLLMPSILAASLLVFIFDFTSFGVILILGGARFATLEVEVYRQTFAFFDLPRAAALSLVQLLCTFALTAIYTRVSSRVTRTLNVRSSEFTQKPLQTFSQKFFAFVIAVSLFIFLLSPLISLATRSVTRLEADRGQRGEVGYGFTLDYYTALFENERGQAFFVTPFESIRNSLLYAGATMVMAILLGLTSLRGAPFATKQSQALTEIASQRTLAMTAWSHIVSPVQFVLRKMTNVESLFMLPLGTSAVTLGLGFLIAFRSFITSPILIPLAHTVIALPFVVRTLLPTYRAIRPQWRNAAMTLGASPFDVWRRIDLPLIGRAVIVAGAFSFALSLGEFGATTLISRPEFPTITIAIYNFIAQPGGLNYGRAMALSTILMMVT